MATAIKVKPGRARVNMRIKTSETTIELTGAYMSEEVALQVYRMVITGKMNPDAPAEPVKDDGVPA